MVIKAQPRFNAMKPVSDPTAYNPALARRTGEAVSDIGSGVATLGSTLAQVVKGTRDLERQAAIKNAVNYIESETQKFISSGVLSDEEINNGANPYEILKQKIQSLKSGYLEENPAYAGDVSPYMDTKINEKTAPLAIELSKRHYDLAKEKVRQTYINTENMLRDDPSKLDNTLNALPLELKAMIKDGTLTEDVYEKNIDERSAAFIKAAAESLADRGNDDKALAILREKGTYLSEKETEDLETDIKKRASYFRDSTRDKLSIEKALIDKKNLEDEDLIVKTSVEAQLSGDYLKASEIESAVAQLTATGKVSSKVFNNINKLERFEYKELDPKSEFTIANMISSGADASAVRDKINSLVNTGRLSPQSAIKWLNSVKELATSQKDVYFSQGLSALKSMFGNEEVFGDVLNETLDPQRRQWVQVLSEYVGRISDPKNTIPAMDIANMLIAKYKGQVPIVPLVPAADQVGDANVSKDVLYKYRAAREAGMSDRDYLESLQIFNDRKRFEKNRDKIKKGAELLKEEADRDEEYKGFVPYQDAESKAQAQAEMMGR